MNLTTMNNVICTERYVNNTPVKTVLSTANIIKPKKERNGGDGSVFSWPIGDAWSCHNIQR